MLKGDNARRVHATLVGIKRQLQDLEVYLENDREESSLFVEIRGARIDVDAAMDNLRRREEAEQVPGAQL